MEVVFFHDHFITVKNQKLFSSGGINKSLLKRYFFHFDIVILATRNKPERAVDGLSMIGEIGSKLKFVPIRNLSELSPKNYFISFKLIYKLILKTDFSICRLPSQIGLFAAYIAWLKKKPFILEVVGCQWDSLFYYGGFKSKIMAIILYPMTRFIVHKSNQTLYVTNRFLQKRYPSKAKIQTNCSNVEMNLYDFVQKKRTKSIEKNSLKNIKLGIIGALSSKYKGFQDLLQAMGMLNMNTDDIDYYLEIVGGGNSDDLVKLIQRYDLTQFVKIVGNLSFPEGVMNWLDSIDIYVQPSLTEGLPRALLEAMSRGCPCVASNAGGIPELLDPQCIHKRGNYNDLLNKIDYITNKETMLQQSERNFNFSKQYSKSVLEAKRRDFFQKIIKQCS